MSFIFATGFDTSWFKQRDPFEALDYAPPPAPPSNVVLVDNGDGTLTTPKYNRMWTKADSYADLGRCLNYFQAVEYVKSLKTGGFKDWQIPQMGELAMIYDNTKENVMGWDHGAEYPLALSEQFADGAAYWYWSADVYKTELTDCCGETFYFVNGMAHQRRLTSCMHGGVRAMRKIIK